MSDHFPRPGVSGDAVNEHFAWARRHFEEQKRLYPLHVKIRRNGRFSWYLSMSEGVLGYGDWIVLGTRRRAERVARRKLVRQRKKMNREDGIVDLYE